jgi:oxygen-independent coproporphyrinogen-3 oxidase
VHCVETSPDSLTEEHLVVLRKHGIGRVSMGTQSLHDDQLGDVNRNHTAEQTLRACKLALEAGLILNVDLMYGLPGQTLASFRQDFATLAETGVPSLTIYDLRLNERTPVARNLQDKERLELAQLLSWRQFVGATARASQPGTSARPTTKPQVSVTSWASASAHAPISGIPSIAITVRFSPTSSGSPRA